MIGMVLGYLFFVGISLMLVFINRVSRKTYFTVSNYLIIPCIIITGVQVITCSFLGLQPAPVEFWAYYVAFFIIAIIADSIGHAFANRATINGRSLKAENAHSNESEYSRAIDIVCLGSALYAFIHLITIISGLSNIYFLVQEQFQSKYTSGANFYFRLILMIGTVYYWGSKDKSKKNILMGLVCFIPNVFTFVKSIIFLSCLGVFICKMKKHAIRLSLKTVAVVLGVGVIVFFGVNMIEMGIYNFDILTDRNTYEYIGAKLAFYLISGVQGFAQNLSNGYSGFKYIDNVTLAPFVNFLSKIGIGSSIRPVTPISQTLWYSTVLARKVGSNVNGYVGTLFLYNGLFVGNLLNFLWVFLASFFDECYGERDDFLSALAALFSGAFALGWFDYYFSQTFWFYLIVLAYIINAFARLRVVVSVRKGNTQVTELSRNYK